MHQKRMSEEAVKFINEGDHIFIDNSTTCFPIAELIDDMPLCVLTNSHEVVTALSNKENIRICSLGGEFHHQHRAFFGRTAVMNFEQYNLDKAFISCKSLSMEHGISDQSEKSSELYSCVLKLAREVYLVVDHAKFGWDAFVHTGDFSRIKAIITDEKLSREWESFFENLKIPVLICVS